MAWALYEDGIQRAVKKCWLPVTVFCIAGFALIFTRYDSIYALCPTAVFHLTLAVLRNIVLHPRLRADNNEAALREPGA